MAAIEAAAEAITYNELGDAALDAAARLVGASNVLLYRYDDRGVVQGVAGTLAVAIPSYARELFDEDPVQHHLLGLTVPDGPLFTAHGMDRRTYLRSGAYHCFYRPHDVHHLLGLGLNTLPYGAPGMAGILFTRAPSEPDFDEHDADLLGEVIPSFRAAARRIQRLERTTTEHRTLGTLICALAPDAHVVFNLGGRALWISPEAENLLAPVLGPGPTLPRALVDAAERMGALASGERVGGNPFTTTIALPRCVLRVELRLARAPRGERLVVATLSTPPTPSVPAPGSRNLEILADLYRLTRAEMHVLGCLGEGLSNRDIGRRLFVSVETVKTHVQRILSKLGVASRTQAALLVNQLPQSSPSGRGALSVSR